MELYNPTFIKRSLNIPAMINLINANHLRVLDTNSHGQAIGYDGHIERKRYERSGFISLVHENLLRIWQCCLLDITYSCSTLPAAKVPTFWRVNLTLFHWLKSKYLCFPWAKGHLVPVSIPVLTQPLWLHSKQDSARSSFNEECEKSSE